jgi:ADP-ribose pyrophosphatase YjhB (NUDIX family)
MNDVTRRLAFERLIAAHPAVLVTDVAQDVSQSDFDLQQQKSRRGLGGAIGILLAPGGQLVLVRRTGLYAGWALPGGTVEIDEPVEDAFRREIQEEIGVGISAATLFLVETKRLVSPAGEQATFFLAVFGARMDEEVLPPATPDALSEGLEAALFRPDDLPAPMILCDREKIDMYLAGTPGDVSPASSAATP